MKRGLQLSFLWVILLIKLRFPITFPCWQYLFQGVRYQQCTCWCRGWLLWFRWMRSRFFCYIHRFQLHNQLLRQRGLIQHLIIRGLSSLLNLRASWRCLRVVICSSFTRQLCLRFSFPMGGLRVPRVERRLQHVVQMRA